MIGALFDWDGVVIDSAKQHEQSWERLAAESGLPLFDGHFKAGFGRKNEYIIPEILRWTSDPAEIRRLSLRKEELYRQIILEQGTEPLPGVRDFLQRLQSAHIPAVIGSSTHRANIETILRITHLTPFFAKIFSAEDVTLGKPHPEIFLKAAAGIQRRPEHCIVFEDAIPGLEAARAGGMRAIGVATTHPAAHLEHLCDRVVHRLDELTAEDLKKLISD